MRYVRRQKLCACGDDFAIEDAGGREARYVGGRVLALGGKLIFEHPRGHEVARVEQKLLSIGPTWVVSRDGREIATVRKSLFTFLHARFSIDVPGPDDLEARGSFLEHEYTFTRGGRVVAEGSKSGLSIR